MVHRQFGRRMVGVLLGTTLALATTVGVAFAERGYTTWYGPGFHGNRTANGEVFNQNDFTTASNRHAFGTWLKVTNPNNGKSVYVRVNDRGGFGHALDLSRAAFFALDPPNSWGFWIDFEVVPGPGAAAAAAPAMPQAPRAAAPKPPAAAPAPTPKPPAPAPAPKPAAAPAPAPSAKPSAPAVPEDATEHVVGPGETLRAIAAAAGVSLSQLIELNELTNPNLLQPGQTLVLRPKPPAPQFYEVEPGDWLRGIAQKLGVDPESLMSANELDDPDLLQPGQKLRIPD